MSREIDQQIVKMEFDNKNFERNTKQSLSTIDKLKKALNFDEEAKSIKELERAANRLTLDDIGASLENIKKGFEGWGLVGKKIIWDLTGEFEKFGKTIIRALNAPFSQIKSGGWARAMKIKDAKFSIEGLGKDFSKFYDDIDYAVKGTAYGFDSAAKAAAQFAASGIKVSSAGGIMATALRSVSGIAAQTNSSYDDIANIFVTIAANGKLMTQQLRQLSFRGMNASAVLAKSLGTSEAAVQQMVTDGKVSFEQFAKAMDDAFGAHATAANETFQGALDNMKAALSRIGANFADPIIDAERDVFNATRDIINSLNSTKGAYSEYRTYMDNQFKKDKKGNTYIAQLGAGDVLQSSILATYMKDLRFSFGKLTEAEYKEYDALDKLSKRTKEQEKRYESLGVAIKKNIKIGKDGEMSLINLADNYANAIAMGQELTAAQKLEYETAKSALDGQRIYTTEAAKTAVKNLNALEKVKHKTKEQREEIERLKKAIQEGTFVGTGSFTRQAEEFVKGLNTVKNTVIGFLQSPGIMISLNYLVDGFTTLFKNLADFAEPIGKAFRTIFNENEVDILVELTKKFKDFTQSLRLSKEYGEDVYNIFTGVFTVFNILKTVVGDVFHVVWAIAGPALGALVKLAGSLTDAILELEYRFMQVRAAIQFTVGYFADAVKESGALQRIFNGLVKVVRTFGRIASAVAMVVGGVLLGAIMLVVTALSKLAGVAETVYNFIKPVLSSLAKFFGTIGKTISSVFNKITKPVNTLSDGTDKLNKSVGNIGSKTIPIIKVLATVVGIAAVAIRDFVVNGITKLSDAIANFSLEGFVLGIKEKFLGIVEAIRSGAMSIPDLIGNGIITVLEKVIGLFGRAGQAVANFFGRLFKGKSIIASVGKGTGGFLDKVKEFFKAVGESDAMKKFSEGLGTVTGKLKDFVKELTPARVFALLFIGATIAIVKAIYDLSKAITVFITTATGVPTSITGMFDSIKGFFKQLTANITPAKKASTQFKEIAEGIVMISLSIALLSKLDPDGLRRGAAILVGATVLVVMFYGLMAVIGHFAAVDVKTAAMFAKIVGSFLAISGALLVLALALAALSKIRIDVGATLANLAVALVAMLGLVGVIALFSRWDKGVKTNFLVILSFAASLLLLVEAFKKLIGIPVLAMWEALVGLVPVILAVAGIAFALGRIKFTNSLGLLLVITAIAMSIPILKQISKMDWKPVQNALTAFTAIMAVILIINTIITILTKSNAFEAFGDFGRGMMNLAVAFMLFGAAIQIIGTIKPDVLKQGIIALSWLTVLVLTMEGMSVYTTGNGMKDFSKGVLLISVAFGMMAALIVIIGSLDLPTLAKGIGALLFLTAYVDSMMYFSRHTKGIDSKGMGLMIALTVDIVALCVALSVLAEQPWDKLLSSTAALAVVLFAFSFVISKTAELAKNATHVGGSIALLITLCAAIAGLVTALVLLSSKPWDRLIGAAGAMGICMVAFAASFAMIEKALRQFQIKTMLPNMALMGVLVVAIGAMSFMLYQLAERPWDRLAGAAVAIGTCLVAFAVSFGLIEKSLRSIQLKTMLINLGVMFAVMVAFIPIGIALNVLAEHPWDRLAGAAAAIGTCLIAFAGAIKILNKIKIDPSALIGIIPSMAIILVIAGALWIAALRPWDQMAASGVAMGLCLLAFGSAMKKLDGIKIDLSSLIGFAGAAGVIYVIGLALEKAATNPWDQIAAAGGSIAVCLLAFGGMMKLISGVKINPTAIFGFLGGVALIAAIGAALYFVAQQPWESILAAAGAIIGTLAAVTVVIAILGMIPAAAGVLAAINIIGFIGTLAGLLLALDALFSIGKGEGLDTIVDLFSKLGEMFGSMISGFQKGLSDSAPEIGTNMSAFAENAKAFFDIISQVDGESLKAAMEGIASGVASIIKVKFNNIKPEDYENLGDIIGSLGEGLSTFASATTDVNPEDVKTKAEALSAIMKAMNNMPRNGGAWADIFGDREGYALFTQGIEMMGPALIQFQNDTEGLNSDAVSAAATAMGMLTEFMGELPRNGGLLGDILGNREGYALFVQGLELIGPALKQFGVDTKDIDNEAIQQASVAMGMINEFAKEIPNSGGVAGFFAGNNDIDDFADKLPAVGEGLAGFSEKLSGVTPNTVQTFCRSIKDLAEASASIASVNSGTVALKEFAAKLPSVAEKYGKFQKNIPDAMTTKVSEFIKNMNTLKNFAKNFSGTTVKGVLDFTKDLNSMAYSGLDAVSADAITELRVNMGAAIGEITATYEEFKAAGANQVGAFTEGVSGACRSIKTQWESNLDITLSDLNNYYQSEFEEFGGILTGQFAKGISKSDKVREVTTAAAEMAKAAMASITDVIKNPYSGDDAYKAGSNLANTFVMSESDLAEFSSAGGQAIGAFVKAISDGTKDSVKAWGAVLRECTSGITTDDNKTKFKGAGQQLTRQFSYGIKDSQLMRDVREAAWDVGKAAIDALDKATKDPEGVSDEALKLGRAFTNGFKIGIKSLQKYSDQASADIGYSAVQRLDDSIEDPAGVSDKTFDLGKAFGKGFTDGITSFKNAVANAASQLGWAGLDNLDLSIKGVEKRLKSWLSDNVSEDFANGLFGAISGIKKKAKNYKKEMEKFFDGILPKDVKKAFDEANDDVKDGVDKMGKTAKGSKGSGSKYKWTNKDATEALLYLTNIFKLVETKYDAFNKKLLKNGKATTQYIASSIKDTYLANAVMYLDKDGKVSKKINKRADKIYKEIYDAELKAEKKKQKAQAKKKGVAYKFDKKKAEENIRAKAVEQATRKEIKAYEKESKAFNTMLKGMIPDKTLRKSLKSMPSFMGTFLENYDPDMKGLSKDLKRYGKEFKKNGVEKAVKAYGALGTRLYQNSDEYKENIKQLKANAKEYENLKKKAKKWQAIVNDPKATAKQKQRAKEELAAISKRVDELDKANRSIAKQIAKGPEKAIKKLKKEIKAAVKDYVALSNVDYSKVLSGFGKTEMSNNLKDDASGYDIFSVSLKSMTQAANETSDALGILNATTDSGINLLERFSKVSSMSARRLMKNAEGQLKGYAEFQNGIESMRRMGFSETLIKDLESQGPQALSQIRGFLKMTSDQVSTYNGYISQKLAYDANKTENEMQKQIDTYKEWLTNLQSLTGKLPAGMLKELEKGGVSNAEFVKMLTHMDQATLDDISLKYAESAASSLRKAIFDDTENGYDNFRAGLKDQAEKYEQWNADLEKLAARNVSKDVIDKLRSMGLDSSRAYIDDILKETDEGIAEINEYFKKSQNQGRSAADIWIENMSVTTDTYRTWESNMKAIKQKLGKTNPLYETLNEMGWEAGSEYADAFVKADAATQAKIMAEFEKQQKVNSEAIAKSLQSRVDKVTQWAKDLETLSKRGGMTADVMDQIYAWGIEGADDVHALVEMSQHDFENYTRTYDDALHNLPKKVANTVADSYARIAESGTNAYTTTVTKAATKYAEATNASLGHVPDKTKSIAEGAGKQIADHAIDATQKEVTSEGAKQKLNSAYTEAITNVPKQTKNANIEANQKLAREGINAMAKEVKSDTSVEKVTKATNKVISSATTEAKPKAESSGTSIGKKALKGVTNTLNTSSGKLAGANFAQGIANGIASKTGIVVEAAARLANLTYKALKDGLKEKSPSRLTYEAGKFFDEGLAEGIDDYTRKSVIASNDLANAVTDRLLESVSAVSETVNQNIGTISPTITPTLDLSGYTYDDISNVSLRPRLDLTGANAKVSDISAKLDKAPEMIVTLNKDANKDVVSAINSLAGQFNSDMGTLADAMGNTQIVMDTGRLVGELAVPMDSAMGKMMANRRRGM